MKSCIVSSFASDLDSKQPQAQPASIIGEAILFSVGIQEIDEEHQQLFRCLDTINAALHSAYSFSAAYQALETLSEYTRTHFRVEECLMRIMKYPFFKEHQAQHHAFIAELDVLRDKMLRYDAAPDMSQFLTDWLLNHIKISDTDYARFFVEQGFVGDS
jgi:hemerythrin